MWKDSRNKYGREAPASCGIAALLIRSAALFSLLEVDSVGVSLRNSATERCDLELRCYNIGGIASGRFVVGKLLGSSCLEGRYGNGCFYARIGDIPCYTICRKGRQIGNVDGVDIVIEVL